jgi:hypothetical protein
MGIVAGQSKTTQEGFDRGYREGADYALWFGQTLGEMMGLSKVTLEEGLGKEVDELVVEGNRGRQIGLRRTMLMHGFNGVRL